MTFLNPFVLFGLAAAAIPILIHLFNIRKLQTIEFSTLTFLKELQKNKMRKIKIRQWLLLALRTLLILLIVLAFSRPALKGSFGSAGTRAKTTVVVLLDNTASMILNNEHGKFLSQAQAQAMKIVSALQENDDMFFLRLSDLPKATTEEPTRDLKRIEALIRETEISYNARSIEDGLRFTAQLLLQSKNFNKEVYVITDGQATTLHSKVQNTSQSERLFEPQVRFFYTQLSQRQAENIAIEKATVLPSLFQVNKPFLLKVIIKNFGTTESKNHLVSITIGKNRIMQKSVTLNGGESATLEFPITPSHSGFISGFVEMESDLFEADDRWYFSVHIPSQRRITIIAPEEKYSRYISTALNTAKFSDASSPLEIINTSPSQLTSASLTNCDVVIFSGVKNLSQTQIELLQQYIVSGGSAIFFPTSDTTNKSYNYLNFIRLTDFKIDRNSTTFEKVDLQFPVFYGMFEQGLQLNKINVETPTIRSSINTVSETNLRSVITMANGKNFLWQKEFGKGKILGFAVPATTDLTDFPLKGIFVPLVYQSVIYLSSPVAITENEDYVVGERIEFNSSQMKKGGTFSPSSLRLFDTESRIIPLQTYTKTTTEGISQSIFTFEQTTKAGIYSVQTQDDTVFSLPINIHRDESNSLLASNDEVISQCERMGISSSQISLVSPDDDLETIMLQSRFGIELWRYFLILAVIVAFIEMFIAREPKQKV